MFAIYTPACNGTNVGTASSYQDLDDRFHGYRREYENCTEVLRNVEIVSFSSKQYDFSFLENIRVVHGYVLIYGNLVDRVPLKSLRVIRGRMLHQNRANNNYSLFVHGNSNLRQLWLDSLTGVYRCVLLCSSVLSYLLICPDFWSKLFRIASCAECNFTC